MPAQASALNALLGISEPLAAPQDDEVVVGDVTLP